MLSDILFSKELYFLVIFGVKNGYLINFVYEMGREGISFDFEFVRISWGIFILLFFFYRLNVEGFRGFSNWYIYKLVEFWIFKLLWGGNLFID